MAAFRKSDETVTEIMLRNYGREWFMTNAPINMRRALAAGVEPKNLDGYRNADERMLLALEAKAAKKTG